MVNVIRNRAGQLLLLLEEDEQEGAFRCVRPNGSIARLEARQLRLETQGLLEPPHPDIGDVQLLAYQRAMAAAERVIVDEEEQLRWDALVTRHREGYSGRYFKKGDEFPFDVLVERLSHWMRNSREAVVGTGFNRAVWIETSLGRIQFGIHADTPARGIANFLKLIDRAGGPSKLSIYEEDGLLPGIGHGPVVFRIEGRTEPARVESLYTTRLW